MANLPVALQALRQPAIRRPPSKFPFVFDLYRCSEPDNSIQWRWRLWAKNGRIVANSGEAFQRRADAVRICDRLTDCLYAAEIFVEGEKQS